MNNDKRAAPSGLVELQTIFKESHQTGQKILLMDNLANSATLPDSSDLLLDLGHLNSVVDLDQENFTVTAEGGINFTDLRDQLAAKGFFLPLDNYLSSQSSLAYQLVQPIPSFYHVKYGAFRQYVTGLEVILPDGTLINLGGKCIKNVSGYDLMGLFIGSGERLGLITKATLRLLPVPEARQVVSTVFDKLSTAVTAATHLLLDGSIPARLQVLNGTLASATTGSARSLLVAEFDGFKEAVTEEIQLYKKIVSDYSNETTEITQPDKIAKLWLKLNKTVNQAAKSSVKLSFASQLTELPGLTDGLSQSFKKNSVGIAVDPGNCTGLVLPMSDKHAPDDWSHAEAILNRYPGYSLPGEGFKNPALDNIFYTLVSSFEGRKTN